MFGIIRSISESKLKKKNHWNKSIPSRVYARTCLNLRFILKLFFLKRKSMTTSTNCFDTSIYKLNVRSNTSIMWNNIDQKVKSLLDLWYLYSAYMYHGLFLASLSFLSNILSTSYIKTFYIVPCYYIEWLFQNQWHSI